MNNNLFATTLIKSFALLDCFHSDAQELTIKDIAAQIDMPQSSVYRMLQSLEFIGFIFQNRENKKYRLGPKLLSLSQKTGILDKNIQIASKYMEQISRETHETVNLGILNCDRVTYIHRIECDHILRPNFRLFEDYPACKTGFGMVLLAELSDSAAEWVYENNAQDLSISCEDFLAELHQIREQGYATDDQIFCQGLRCVASPIRGPGNKALFSVSVSAPSLRMDNETYQKTRSIVMRYAAAASEDIQSLS